MESYIESVRADIARRNEKVQQAADMVKHLINTYGTFVDMSGTEDTPRNALDMPPVSWPEPNGKAGGAWLTIHGKRGLRVYENEIADPSEKHRAVDYVSFMVTVDDDPEDFMTVDLSPPQVYGYDTVPLPLHKLDGALNDLALYEQRIQAEAVDPS